MCNRLLTISLVLIVGGGSVLCPAASARAGPRDATLVTKLVSPAGGAWDMFGTAVALAEGDLLVSAPLDDTADADAGAVYVYTVDDNVWTQSDTLLPSDVTAGQFFGWSIAVDHDNPGTVVIGATGDDDVAVDAGAAYVFVRSTGGAWIEQAKLVGTDTPDEAWFGGATDIDDDTIVIGAPMEDNYIGSFAGNAYVFEHNGLGQWVQTDKWFPIYGGSAVIFGSAVAIDGDLAVVGAPYLGMSFYGAGFAVTFSRTESGWEQEQYLDSPGVEGRDRFGSSAALVGEHAILGSPRDIPPTLGAIATFRRQVDTGGAATWESVQFLFADDPVPLDRFGSRLVTDGARLLVSAPTHNETGAVYLHDFEDGIASFVEKITADDGAPNDRFGSSLAFDGETIVIGAYLDDDAGTDAGAVYVYALSSPEPPGDSDGDGVPDDCDACPYSDLSDTVVIDGCDTTVPNMMPGDDGCTMADRLAQCAEGTTTHKAFVRCVAHLTNEWKRDGLISGPDKGRIQRCAAQADIPPRVHADLLTSPGAVLTAFGSRFDVEPEAAVGFALLSHPPGPTPTHSASSVWTSGLRRPGLVNWAWLPWSQILLTNEPDR